MPGSELLEIVRAAAANALGRSDIDVDTVLVRSAEPSSSVQGLEGSSPRLVVFLISKRLSSANPFRKAGSLGLDSAAVTALVALCGTLFMLRGNTNWLTQTNAFLSLRK